MLTRFDHAVVAVRSLDSAIALWSQRLGFDTRPGGRHMGRGTYNAIVRFGLDYVELISIDDRSLVDARMEPNALALAQRLDAGEGGLLGFALATDAASEDAARFRQNGFDVAGPASMERMRPDGRLLQWRLLVPEDGSWGKPLPFFIEWDTADAERLRWEQPGSHANGATAIAALAITVADLDAAVELYQRGLGLALVERDAVPDLGAARARFRIGSTLLDLLAPTGAGAVADAVRSNGEGPWQLTLFVGDLAAARRLLTDNGVRLQSAPGTPQGVLIASEDALQARVVFVERE